MSRSVFSWEEWFTRRKLLTQRWLTWMLFAAVAAFLTGLAWVTWLIGSQGREYVWAYVWAAFWSSGGGILSDRGTYFLGDRYYDIADGAAWQWMREHIYRSRTVADLFGHFVWSGFAAWTATLTGLRWYFGRPMPTEGEGRTLRGTVVLPSDVFARRAVGAGEPGLALGNVRIPRAVEAAHLALLGATRTGKSALIRQALAQLAERGAAAVIFDPEAELLQEHYDPARGDVILNPLDARAHAWELQDEGVAPSDFRNLAQALVPPSRDESDQAQFWQRGAWQVLVDLFGICGLDPARLARTLRSSVEDLATEVAGTPSAALISPKAAAQAMGLLGTLAPVGAALDLVAGAAAARGGGHPPGAEAAPVWSARRWAQHRRGWVFLTSTESDREAVHVLTSAWISLLITHLLDTELDAAAEREVWLVVDELPVLRRLATIESAFARGAKRGLRVVMGLQTVGQLRERYGREAAATILAQPATTVLLRAADPDSARWAADRIGQREREVATVGLTAGVTRFRDSLDMRDQRREDYAVLPAEIQALENLRGYIAVAGVGVTALEVTPRPWTPRVPGFVPHPTPVPATDGTPSSILW